MRVGFLFWPFTPNLVRELAADAERYGYDLIGIADTPGNAMDPWVAATMVAQATQNVRIALCVSNLTSRHPAVSAAAIASLDLLAPGRTILGIGAGHSGTRNLGIRGSGASELADGADFIRTLLGGKPATWRSGQAHLPWVRQPIPSLPRRIRTAGARRSGKTSRGPRTRFARLLRRRVTRDRILRSGIWPRWTATLMVRCRDSGSEPFSLLWRPVTSSAAI